MAKAGDHLQADVAPRLKHQVSEPKGKTYIESASRAVISLALMDLALQLFLPWVEFHWAGLDPIRHTPNDTLCDMYLLSECLQSHSLPLKASAVIV